MYLSSSYHRMNAYLFCVQTHTHIKPNLYAWYGAIKLELSRVSGIVTCEFKKPSRLAWVVEFP